MDNERLDTTGRDKIGVIQQELETANPDGTKAEFYQALSVYLRGQE